MKTLSEKVGIKRLARLRDEFRLQIVDGFEANAKDCITCEVKGSCCTDAHFVNVQITRLDASAIKIALEELSPELQEKVRYRNEEVVVGLSLTPGATYSCPLFEPGHGCLVHETAKPLPCINHACYESAEDLPPDSLLSEGEKTLSRLNDRVYRSNWNWLPIPIWIEKILDQKTKQ